MLGHELDLFEFHFKEWKLKIQHFFMLLLAYMVYTVYVKEDVCLHNIENARIKSKLNVSTPVFYFHLVKRSFRVSLCQLLSHFE